MKSTRRNSLGRATSRGLRSEWTATLPGRLVASIATIAMVAATSIVATLGALAVAPTAA